MKLSEAILLGSTVVTPKAGTQYSPVDNSGCALGMAAIARGCTFAPVPHLIVANDRRTAKAEDIWGSWLVRVIPRPCDCPIPFTFTIACLKEMKAYLFDVAPTLPREMPIKEIIAHLFDFHVMAKKDWTIDQLVASVERWEPSEPIHEMAAHDPMGAWRARAQDLSDARDWRKTREAFDSRQKPRFRPGV